MSQDKLEKYSICVRTGISFVKSQMETKKSILESCISSNLFPKVDVCVLFCFGDF